MKVKHTPGPWRVGFKDGSGMGTIVTEEEKDYGRSGELPVKSIARLHWGCSCCDPGEESMTPEDRANAILIHAAPDLLAACEEAARQLEVFYDHAIPSDIDGSRPRNKLEIQLRTAIRKARGEE